MSYRVKVSDIVDALEMVSDTSFVYLHRPTGRLVTVTEDALRAAERDDDPGELSDWETEARQEAKEVLSSSEYLELPTRFDIHEYSIMEGFCLSIDDEGLRDDLLTAISGRGAFRCFKDTIQRRGIADQWYRYRGEAFSEIAIRWLEDSGIEHDSSDEAPDGAPPN